jgi:hypothetical protein
MSTPNTSTPQLVDDTGFIGQLLPNRGTARFFRAIIHMFLAIGVLAGLSLVWDVYVDIHARSPQSSFLHRFPTG